MAIAWNSVQTATSDTVTKPTSLAVGDLMVAQVHASGSITPPTGWTLVGVENSGSLGRKYANYSKVADASDVAASTFTFTNGVRIACHRISGGDLVSPVVASNQTFRSTNSGKTLTTPGVTPGIEVLLLILFHGLYNTSESIPIGGYAIANNNPSWTEVLDSDVTVSSLATILAAATASYSNLTATGTVTVTSAAGSDPLDESLVSILAIQPSIVRATIFGSTFSVTQPSVFTIFIATAIALASTVPSTVTSIITALWRNAAKHTASWRNTPKS